MKRKLCLLLIPMLLLCGMGMAQIPVEVFAGHQRATLDIMFFKFVKKQNGDNSRWLFFNRNRAGVDYRITKTNYLPQFGCTEAISWNHKRLRGFAPVIVAQVFNSGVYSKAGLQYARITKTMTVFSWVVCETKQKPTLDYFLLVRYTPKLTTQVKLFTQLESVNALPTTPHAGSSFTQRFRLGLQWKGFQFGAGADLNQTGISTFTQTMNIGAFIRHEF